MIKPKTRKEKLLSAIANDTPVPIQPKNREEIFLAQIAEKVNIVNAPVAESISEEAHVLIEDGGEVKRVAKSKVGGGGGASSLDDLLAEEVAVLLEEETLTYDEQAMGAIASKNVSVDSYEAVSVVWDGTKYLCAIGELPGMKTAGNIAIIGEGADTGEPFFIGFAPESTMFAFADTAATPTVEIRGVELKKIPAHYLTEAVAVKFYTGEDSYLYKDLGSTTKATAEDLVNAIGGAGFRVISPISGPPYAERAPLMAAPGGSGDYAIAVIDEGDFTKTKVLHTAEYTPTT